MIVDYYTTHHRIIENIPPCAFYPTPRTVFVPATNYHGYIFIRVVNDELIGFCSFNYIVWVNRRFKETNANSLLRRISEDPFDGWAFVQRDSISTDDSDAICASLGKRSESPLALPQGVLCRLALGDVPCHPQYPHDLSL